MKYIEFGQNKTLVSNIVLGCMRIPKLSTDEVIKFLDTASSVGINMLDTADVYSQGKSEELLGEAFLSKLSAVFVKTPIYMTFQKNIL